MNTLRLTRKQLAQRWSVDEKTIRNWDNTGLTPPIEKLGPRKNTYRMEDVLIFEAEREVRRQVQEKMKAINNTALTIYHGVSVSVDLTYDQPESQ